MNYYRIRKDDPWWMWALLVLFLIGLFGIFVVAPLYSNYQVCKEYYSKISPLTCMMSTKTKLSGDK